MSAAHAPLNTSSSLIRLYASIFLCELLLTVTVQRLRPGRHQAVVAGAAGEEGFDSGLPRNTGVKHTQAWDIHTRQQPSGPAWSRAYTSVYSSL